MHIYIYIYIYIYAHTHTHAYPCIYRYERYLQHKDSTAIRSACKLIGMSDWEAAREVEEFEKSSAMYNRPSAALVAADPLAVSGSTGVGGALAGRFEASGRCVV
jgi:hypothetical protein